MKTLFLTVKDAGATGPLAEGAEREMALPAVRVYERGIVSLAALADELTERERGLTEAVQVLGELLESAKARLKLVSAQLDGLDLLAGKLPADA